MPHEHGTKPAPIVALTAADLEVARMTGTDLEELRRFKQITARGAFACLAPDRQKLPFIIQR